MEKNIENNSGLSPLALQMNALFASGPLPEQELTKRLEKMIENVEPQLERSWEQMFLPPENR